MKWNIIFEFIFSKNRKRKKKTDKFKQLHPKNEIRKFQLFCEMSLEKVGTSVSHD